MLSFQVILLGISLLSGWLGFTAIQGLPSNSYLIPAVLCGITVLSPTRGLMFLLAGLPIAGGHYPATQHSAFFFATFSCFIATLGLSWLYHTRVHRRIIDLHTSNPIALFLVLWVGFVLLSLSSLPIDEIMTRWAQLPANKALSLQSLKEVFALYPVHKSFFFLQCAFLFVVITHYPSEWGGNFKHWSLSLVSGILLTLGVGLLDYYGLIDLRPFRALDGHVNPNNIEIRLQSFFGHSSWCAQYLTLTIPFSLFILTLNFSRWIKLSGLVGLMVLGEFVLILTFQRGGWVAYPFTVFILWICIYALSHEEKAPQFLLALKRSAWKIVLSLPITVLLSLGLFSLINQELPSKYIERFKAISNTNERTFYIPVALNLASLHPIAGGGAESFGYRYVQGYRLPNAPFARVPNSVGIFFGNAHSLYLSLLTGIGYSGLLCALSLLGSIFWVIGRIVGNNFRNPSTDTPFSYQERIILMISLCYTVSLSVYGLVEDLFYTPLQVVLFFFTLGMLVKTTQGYRSLSKSHIKKISIAFTLIAIAHLTWEYVTPGETWKVNAHASHQGCYDPEPTLNDSPNVLTWCSQEFDIEIPAKQVEGMSYGSFQLKSVGPATSSKPMTLEIRGEKVPPQTINLTRDAWQWIVVRAEQATSENLKISVKANFELIPAYDVRQRSLDSRKLSVLVNRAPASFFDPQKENIACEAVQETDHILCSDHSILWQQKEWSSVGKGTKSIALEIKSLLLDTSWSKPHWVWVSKKGATGHLIRLTDNAYHALSEWGLTVDPSAQYVLSSSQFAQEPGTEATQRVPAFEIRPQQTRAAP